LVRSDVSAVLFDEPLTVIDPHLKWQLRRKLKQIHRELKLTLIYVTHDQVEALTFANEVLVMSRGRVMQVGSAKDLFERPAHTFVGHFIGSPGMNFVPAHHVGGQLTIAGLSVKPTPSLTTQGDMKLGIRPEHLQLGRADEAGTVPAEVKRVQMLGSYALVTCRLQEHELRLRLTLDQAMPQVGAQVHLHILSTHTCIYQNEEWVA